MNMVVQARVPLMDGGGSTSPVLAYQTQARYTPQEAAYMKERGGVIATTVVNSPPPDQGLFKNTTNGVGALLRGNSPVVMPGPADALDTIRSGKDATFSIPYWIWLIIAGLFLVFVVGVV